jgi:hypothetical protein
MNFDDTPDEAAFRATARAWLAAHKFDYRSFQGDDGVFQAARKWQAIKFDAGWGCLHWPKAYGGKAATTIENVIFGQEEEAAGMSLLTVINTITIGMAAATIMHCGTEAQKARHLQRIARGEEIWCQLFSEPAAGSDLAGIRTRAVRDGDDWVINGQKMWTTYAQYSDWAILIARSDPTVPKHKGLTYFLLDMKSPGVLVRPIKQASGGSDFNEVFFEDVRIPDSCRVGNVGDGWRVAITTLMNERAAVTSIFPTNFDEAWALANKTPLHDGMAIDDSAVRGMLADWYVWGRGLQNFGLRMRSLASQGKTPGPEASVAKLMLGAQRQNRLAELLDMLDMGGAAAAGTQPYGLHFAFFRVIGNRLEGGTDEVLRNIIAERVLGLPPEPRVDKDTPFNRIPTALSS